MTHALVDLAIEKSGRIWDSKQKSVAIVQTRDCSGTDQGS